MTELTQAPPMTDTDIAGLVTRLDERARHASDGPTADVLREAARALERLQAERDGLDTSEIEIHAHTARKLLDSDVWVPSRLLWARLVGHLEAAIALAKK